MSVGIRLTWCRIWLELLIMDFPSWSIINWSVRLGREPIICGLPGLARIGLRRWHTMKYIPIATVDFAGRACRWRLDHLSSDLSDSIQDMHKVMTYCPSRPPPCVVNHSKSMVMSKTCKNIATCSSIQVLLVS
jgi:hypothetical protein